MTNQVAMKAVCSPLRIRLLMKAPASMPEELPSRAKATAEKRSQHQGDEGQDQAEQGQRFAIALEAAHRVDEQDFLAGRRAPAQFVEARRRAGAR